MHPHCTPAPNYPHTHTVGGKLPTHTVEGVNYPHMHIVEGVLSCTVTKLPTHAHCRGGTLKYYQTALYLPDSTESSVRKENTSASFTLLSSVSNQSLALRKSTYFAAREVVESNLEYG